MGRCRRGTLKAIEDSKLLEMNGTSLTTLLRHTTSPLLTSEEEGAGRSAPGSKHVLEGEGRELKKVGAQVVQKRR